MNIANCEVYFVVSLFSVPLQDYKLFISSANKTYLHISGTCTLLYNILIYCCFTNDICLFGRNLIIIDKNNVSIVEISNTVQ